MNTPMDPNAKAALSGAVIGVLIGFFILYRTKWLSKGPWLVGGILGASALVGAGFGMAYKKNADAKAGTVVPAPAAAGTPQVSAEAN